MTPHRRSNVLHHVFDESSSGRRAVSDGASRRTLAHPRASAIPNIAQPPPATPAEVDFVREPGRYQQRP